MIRLALFTFLFVASSSYASQLEISGVSLGEDINEVNANVSLGPPKRSRQGLNRVHGTPRSVSMLSVSASVGTAVSFISYREHYPRARLPEVVAAVDKKYGLSGCFSQEKLMEKNAVDRALQRLSNRQRSFKCAQRISGEQTDSELMVWFWPLQKDEIRLTLELATKEKPESKAPEKETTNKDKPLGF